MQPNWAEENLQTIRTLMERSATYRRALAPIIIFAGVMGVLAAAAGMIFHLDSPPEFGGLWLGTAMIVVIGAFFNTRRQAINGGETVWSPPTRRVAQALLPPLVIGLAIGVMCSLPISDPDSDPDNGVIFLPFVWALLYGCALHSASFFISRGMKWFGWLYIISTLVIFLCYSGCIKKIIPSSLMESLLNIDPNLFMGFFFGVLHLIYGAYLYLTEKGKNAA